MEKLKNTPELRFPEYNINWERKKIDSFIDFLSGYPFDGEDISENSSGIPLMRGINITEGRIRHSNDIDRFYDGDTTKLNKYFLKEGDLVIGMDGSKVGKNSAIVDKENVDSILVQRVARLREKENSSLPFIYQYINSIRFHKYVDEVKTSSGIPHISAAQIKDFKIALPNLPEQQKIASFLTAIDDKLTQLKQKKSLLEQYKKGVMQKIFSQEIRFKDENGKSFTNWEYKRLDSIVSNFIVPMRDKPKQLDGDIPWCRIEDFDGKYLSKSKSNQGVTKSTVKEMNLKIYPINTLIVSCSANLGFCAIVKHELITNQTFIGLIPDEIKVSVEYLYYIMILSSKKLNILSSGTTISYLSREQFEQFKIHLPCLAEQTKIANFLSALDEKINHCQLQIEKTILYKKGLLQKMFC